MSYGTKHALLECIGEALWSFLKTCVGLYVCKHAVDYSALYHMTSSMYSHFGSSSEILLALFLPHSVCSVKYAETYPEIISGFQHLGGIESSLVIIIFIGVGFHNSKSSIKDFTEFGRILPRFRPLQQQIIHLGRGMCIRKITP